jgi:hypothetical protein
MHWGRENGGIRGKCKDGTVNCELRICRPFAISVSFALIFYFTPTITKPID